MIRDSELRQVHRTRNVQQFVDKINAMVLVPLVFVLCPIGLSDHFLPDHSLRLARVES